jgi:hypothetical protein
VSGVFNPRAYQTFTLQTELAVICINTGLSGIFEGKAYKSNNEALPLCQYLF